MALTAELTKTLTVALSPEMYETIQTKTDEQRISKGELVREALEEYLKNYSNLGEKRNEIKA